MKNVETFDSHFFRERDEPPPEYLDQANRQVFSILHLAGKLLAYFGQQKFLAGTTA